MKHFSVPERSKEEIKKRFCDIRNHTEIISGPLHTEDYVVQPEAFVSPPKWHLAHTSWFFEYFLLKPHFKDYKEFHPDFHKIFNSYYQLAGDPQDRDKRGSLTRPTVKETYEYRNYVNQHVEEFLDSPASNPGKKDWEPIIEIGLQHEQQHQELMWYDIKYILGNNPLYPHYGPQNPLQKQVLNPHKKWIEVKGGEYEIGYKGEGFCYDNELGIHAVKLKPFAIQSRPVTNGEFLEFIKDGGYNHSEFWHDDGFQFIQNEQVKHPLYWDLSGDNPEYYTLSGKQELDMNVPVNHISFYEAAAFAAWNGCRLPTEFEWEASCDKFDHGLRWEWTNSAYLPYPGFNPPEEALGEYNGKFMINQMVLRGGSIATSPGHSRKSYRNFFHPDMRWQFSGIRPAKNL